MPLYEYECTACGHRFEVIQRFSDAPLAKCPKCDGAVRKLLSAPAIHFKGSGWYVTDYGKMKGGDSGGTAAPSSSSSSTPSDTSKSAEPAKSADSSSSTEASKPSSAVASSDSSKPGPSA